MERETLLPPTTYAEWLDCFDMLKSGDSVDNVLIMTIKQGLLINKGYIAVQFHQKLAETISEMLNKRIARFIRDLNMMVSFNDFSDIVSLFVKLRNEIRKCLFFTDLAFLSQSIKVELEQSIRGQMERFWSDTLSFLRKQALEYYYTELENSLFLIQRIELFDKTVRR